ncbi:protein tyrosine phosphatase domain-containing protein 1 [Osmerus eperlanus]|uniref:protein tyrosine phosphatase domain-containing protein 1 n=1 Tax=Osmerus eperlanus TaxID=29151 RepID=UPI002E0D3E16
MDFFRRPRAKYTVVGETIRYVIPGHMQCTYWCGGQACKYDDPSYWSEDKQAIKGIYSSWVTDNIIAMARPSTETIEKYEIINQFRRCGVKTVINLQKPGEHASCGNPLEPDSGFSYRPETFMEKGIYFYNFGWHDYGVTSLTTILDMVKVMAFAVQEGKMAVHCHAGLGRTGVLIACFLVYATRMSADQAIIYVRAKRPNSIQTRGQLRCVREFAKFLVPLMSVFSCAKPWADPVSLSQYLTRQRHMLHGYEHRELRYLPKIIELVCRLLLDIAENRQVIEEDILEVPDITAEMERNIHDLEDDFKFGGDVPRLPGAPTLPRHANEPPIFYHRKTLSYSDTDLWRLGSELNLLANPQTSLSHNDLPEACSASEGNLTGAKTRTRVQSTTSCTSSGSLWEQKNIMTQEDYSLLMRIKQKAVQQSESVGDPLKTSYIGNFLTRWKTEQRKELTNKVEQPQGKSEEEEKSEVPFITIQTELSLEARRLLVAQALAVDLEKEGEAKHKYRVSVWKGELNLQGAWERLYMERDPFVLTGLMWAWLEQLSEPVISATAVQSLDTNNSNPQTVLDTLDQGPKLSLLCILDCMAQILLIPEEVEAAFLDRTIKAFTQLEKSSEEGKEVYKTMTEILRLVLQDKRLTAMEEEAMLEMSVFSD